MTCIYEDNAYGEITPFIEISNILSSRLPRTLEVDASIVLKSDLSFIQNFPKWDKMEMAYELAHNMFKATSIFSLVSVGQGDVLAPNSPLKERDVWKGKAKDMELKCINL